MFVEVYRSISHFRGDAKLSTWIYRIAVTRSLDAIRKKRRKKRFARIQRLFRTENGEEEEILIPHYDTPEKHLEGTQARNDLVLENLRRTLDSEGTRVWIRIPLIPGYNDGGAHLKELTLAIRGMGAEKVSLLGFHQWGKSKYQALGREYPYDGIEPLPKESLESAKRIMEAHGIAVTIDH